MTLVNIRLSNRIYLGGSVLSWFHEFLFDESKKSVEISETICE